MNTVKRQKSIDIIHSIILHHDAAKNIEQAIHDKFHGDMKKYSQKVRSIIFNLKSKSKFREDILQNKIKFEDLPNMNPADIDSTLWDPIFQKAAKKKQINEIINKLAA